jgi:hypothetical protein
LPQEIETLRNTAGALSGRLSVDILRNLEEFSIDVGLTYFLEVMRPISDDRAVPLIDPTVEHSVGLVAVDRDPVSPMVIAAFECARVTEPLLSRHVHSVPRHKQRRSSQSVPYLIRSALARSLHLKAADLCVECSFGKGSSWPRQPLPLKRRRRR